MLDSCSRRKPIAQLFISVLLITTLSACAGKTIKTSAYNGVSRQVFEWGFWNGRCQPAEFTIKITKPPENGVAEMGTDTMTIGKQSASGARMACEGKTVSTKTVNYTANKGYKGVDTMSLSVAGRAAAPRLFTLEIQVR